jgi:hypothetical protein
LLSNWPALSFLSLYGGKGGRLLWVLDFLCRTDALVTGGDDGLSF